MDKTETSNTAVQNAPCVVRTTIGHPVVTTLSAIPATTAPVVVVRTLAAAPTTITSGGIKIASLSSQPMKISTLPSGTSVIRATAPPVQQNPTGGTAVKPLVTSNTTVKPEAVSATQAPTTTVKQEAPPPQRNVIREMQVRVPNRRDKRFSVLRFHSADRPDLSSGLEVFMQRENNLKQFRSVNNLADLPDRGAGSEFGREAKEEARLKKYGIVRESYRPDDQPWVMTVGKGKTGRRRFKGVKEGSVANNVEYFVFCQCKDGNFDAYPVHAWYKMKPEINYRFLREDEAEVEYSRMNKTMNLFNVMIKRKLIDGDEEDAILDREIGKELKFLSNATENRSAAEGESSASRTAKDSKGASSGSTGGRPGDRSLKLTDLEELDHPSDADYDDDDEEEEGAEEATDGADTGKGSNKKRNIEIAGKAKGPVTAAERARLLRKKQRDAAIVTRMRRFVKKRKKKSRVVGSSSEDDDLMEEAVDDSEVDDHEGDEVDYMTNSSSDEEKLSEEEREKIYVETGVDEEAGLKALLTDLSSDEEEDEEAKARAAEDMEDAGDDSTADGDANSRKRRLGDGDKGDGTASLAGTSQSDLPDGSGKLHRARKKQTSEDDNAGGLSSSSSSSSSIDGESSSYSSSSSDVETNADDKIKRNSKKAAVFQKLSESIHGTSSPGTVSTSEASNAGMKRKPLDTSSDSLGLTGGASSTSQPVLKKSRMDSGSVPCDSELMSTVRKYLMRKPITVKELLRKIRIRKLVDKNEDAQAVLAGVLRQLRPIKQIINGQSALSLKH